jgi:hypothetical protein
MVQKVAFTSSPEDGSSIIIIILKYTDNRIRRQYIIHSNTVGHFELLEMMIIALKL